jgi:hypothetical protein
VKTSARPTTWLRCSARFALLAPADQVRVIWNVSARFEAVRAEMLTRKLPELSVLLGVAQGLVDTCDEHADEGADRLDAAVIAAAQVLDRDVATGQFAQVGMLVLLSPPLARAETFRMLCDTLEMVPVGDE